MLLPTAYIAPPDASPKRAKAKLKTDLEVKKAVATGGKAIKLRVDNGAFRGLVLHVEPSGAKYWRYRYQTLDGREHVAALGVYPTIGLADARREHEKACKALAQGIDPVRAKREQKQAAVAAAASTFEVISRNWHQNRLHKWTPDNAVRIWKRLENHMLPTLGKLPVADVTARQILAVLRGIEAAGSYETARRCLQYTAGALRLAVWDGHVLSAVTDAIPEDALTSQPDRHHSRVKPEEIGALLRAIDAANLRPATRLAIALVSLTAVRTTEARAARWTEFDFAAARWAIPAERMKMSEAHIVPLSAQALAILRELHQHTGEGELLFPNTARPLVPMSENTMLYALNRAGYAGRQTVHGFRGLFSTTANESGKWDSDVIELCLAHKSNNAVRSAYNSAQRLPDRTRLMQWWADHLDRARAGATLLHMPINHEMKTAA